MPCCRPCPMYVVDCCKSTTEDDSHQLLSSASRPQRIMPRHRRTSFTGRRKFSTAGLMAWNSLPDYLRDTSLSEDTFKRSLKTYSFAFYYSTYTLEAFAYNSLYKLSTYLFTCHSVPPVRVMNRTAWLSALPRSIHG